MIKGYNLSPERAGEIAGKILRMLAEEDLTIVEAQDILRDVSRDLGTAKVTF